jgi:hypothetical protein
LAVTIAFLEILIPPNSLSDARQAIEDLLEDALHQAAIGEVTGGGSGNRGSNIDCEVTDAQLAIRLIHQLFECEGVRDYAIRQA